MGAEQKNSARFEVPYYIADRASMKFLFSGDDTLIVPLPIFILLKS